MSQADEAAFWWLLYLLHTSAFHPLLEEHHGAQQGAAISMGLSKNSKQKILPSGHIIYPAYMNLAVMDICECFLSDFQFDLLNLSCSLSTSTAREETEMMLWSE